MLTLLIMSASYGKTPAEIMGVEGYTGWCLNEAALYLRERIAEGGLPDAWQPCDNNATVEMLLRRKGVRFNDRRRNHRGNAVP